MSTWGELDFEGRLIACAPHDTVASALFRAGVRVFSRSYKYHRRRGLYCLTGDCPNCLVSVDGQPSVRACVTQAKHGQAVKRERGWPSVDHDLFGIFDFMHYLLPVGFYYKTLLRPRWLWPRVEPLVRRLAGLAEIPSEQPLGSIQARNLHPDVIVVGAGAAGLSAALSAAQSGQSVVICDEGLVGEKLAHGEYRSRVEALAEQVRAEPRISLLEQTTAVGIYEGPLVVLTGPTSLRLVHPGEIVVATGAVESHGVFPGNDLPGVWLARGAARLASAHGIPPGKRVVLVGNTEEADTHAETLRATGAHVTVLHGDLVKAQGRRCIRSVVANIDGRDKKFRCDALVLSLGLVPRDGLLRQGAGLPVYAVGDAAANTELRAGSTTSGIVCLCEDVGADELVHAWQEGFRSTEILKRYTTATMGPCQGAMCHRHVRAFVAERQGATGPKSAPTTARPPARTLTLAQASAGTGYELHYETALHPVHLRLGAKMEPTGAWQRPSNYGDVIAEYWAVRRGVSTMDVGTLGKFLIAGPDATAFLEKLYPCRVANLLPGRLRYALMLGEHGFVVDDGIVCALGDGHWYVTFTSAGSTTIESTLRDWVDTWNYQVHIVDLTAANGAINVAGPDSRELLRQLSDDPLDNEGFPYLHHRSITVAGVPCRAIRLGFVGELGYELHHPSDRSVELWEALTEAGKDMGVRPHGLDALRLLRLEKGHIIVGQDTDFDATPAKLHMDWAVAMDKPWFVGKWGIERAASHAPLRRLVAVSFEEHAPPEGSPITANGHDVGYLTSSGWSHVLGHGVSLGWVSDEISSTQVGIQSQGAHGSIVNGAFYDPVGERLRA